MPDARWSSLMRAFAKPLLSFGTPLHVFVTVLVLAALITAAFAKPIRKGAVMQVKADSIWFDESAQLTHWQELKKSGNAAALTAYQEQMLGQRDAWQFVKPLKVKILRYEPATSQVNVEMKTAGRLQGTTWWLDASAVGQ
jgi:hypothetical protein